MHCWIGSEVPDAVMNILLNEGPIHVIWMAEFARRHCYEDYIDSLHKDFQNEEYDLYEKCWQNESIRHVDGLPISLTKNQYFLINHTRQEYLDVADYIKKNTVSSDYYKYTPFYGTKHIRPPLMTDYIIDEMDFYGSQAVYIDSEIEKAFGQKYKTMCAHSLPLLTICGHADVINGGCFYSEQDKDKIGLWANDLLSVSTDKPDGFKEVSFNFIMSRNII